MVLAKSKNAVGLGNSLMNDRFGKGKGQDRKKVSTGIQRTGPNGESYVVHDKEEASWVKMRSVTEQAALEEFLSTAELAGTDFTAEKLNDVKIIHTDQHNPYLLSAQEERSAVRKHRANRRKLTVPRRPPWDETTTPQELDAREKASLLEWRRGLAELQETQDLLMTPFERNIEVWRQLWRVIERSDLVVQIVDARNPLLFRSEDLESYVREVDPRKKCLLLVNKADMMTLAQREAWADYFEREGINYKFFSAHLARESHDAIFEEEEEEEEEDDEGLPGRSQTEPADEIARAAQKINPKEREAEEGKERSNEGEEVLEDQDSRVRIITVDELESLFLANAPAMESAAPPTATADGDKIPPTRKTQVGLVGYPNVGKSSTINALIGAKKVSVSATPGKTKHFQTIHLSDDLMLCDCPGLVFPNFATTKAELVCAGILPIDQMREYTGPVGLVARRVPREYLEALYGIRIPVRPREEGGTGVPTASELLSVYARARGFATTGPGRADEARASRYVLKDFVNGRILYCHPPPSGDSPIDPEEFNAELYDVSALPSKRGFSSGGFSDEAASTTASSVASGAVAPSARPPASEKSRRLDRTFFGPGGAGAGHLSTPYGYAGVRAGAGAGGGGGGKQLSGRKQKTMIAMENGVDVGELGANANINGNGNGKKHFKGGKRADRAAARKRGSGYED